MLSSFHHQPLYSAPDSAAAMSVDYEISQHDPTASLARPVSMFNSPPLRPSSRAAGVATAPALADWSQPPSSSSTPPTNGPHSDKTSEKKPVQPTPCPKRLYDAQLAASQPPYAGPRLTSRPTSARCIACAAKILQLCWDPNSSFVSLFQFLRHIVGHINRYSSATLVGALLLTVRLRRRYPDAQGERGCSHRLGLVSLLMANKVLDPSRRSIGNRYWAVAAMGAFTTQELDHMELEMWRFLGGNISLPADTMAQIGNKLTSALSNVDQVVPCTDVLQTLERMCVSSRRDHKRIRSERQRMDMSNDDDFDHCEMDEDLVVDSHEDGDDDDSEEGIDFEDEDEEIMVEVVQELIELCVESPPSQQTQSPQSMNGHYRMPTEPSRPPMNQTTALSNTEYPHPSERLAHTLQQRGLATLQNPSLRSTTPQRLSAHRPNPFNMPSIPSSTTLYPMHRERLRQHSQPQYLSFSSQSYMEPSHAGRSYENSLVDPYARNNHPMTSLPQPTGYFSRSSFNSSSSASRSLMPHYPEYNQRPRAMSRDIPVYAHPSLYSSESQARSSYIRYGNRTRHLTTESTSFLVNDRESN